MRTKRVFSCILLIISLVSFNFSSLLVLPVTAQDISQFETTEEVSVYRVYYGSADDIQKLMAFDLFEFNNLDEKYVLVAVNQAELEQIQKMGFSVQFDKEETENYELLFLFLQNQLQTIPGYACYRTVEETFAAAAGLAGTHPNLATWIDVGDSWEKSVGQPDGYDMHVLKLTNAAIPGEKPKLFVTAAIHAREYTTAELATRFAEYLVNNYNVDPDATWLLDYHEIHLMLQTNPDGRKEAESGLSWRKNTNENYCGVTSTSRGADLNRNYSFYWNSCSGCSSGNPCDATYRGPSPASEPEVQAVQTYMRSIFPDQRDASLGSPAPSDAMGIFIDLHSYSELVLWPWGMTSSLAPNNSGLQTLGRKFAFFNNYTPQRSYQLYGTDGDSVDFAYGDLGIAAYTFELGTRFFEYCSTFEGTILPTNLQALIYAAKVASTPYMTPAGPDSLNLALSASTVPAGTSVTLTATANDTRYKSGSGEPTQAIAAGEYYIDTPPWVTGATAFPMSASDGTFNSTTENITATLNTTGWSQGRHTLFLRSRDAAGNWGAVSAVFLTVIVTDNEPPVADDQEISTVEDTAVSIALSGSDPDDNPLTFSVVDGPASGTLSGTAPDLTYTPGANYNGSDSFTYKANDGIADSELATVSLTITSVNDAPVAQNQSLITEVNLPLAIELAGLDVDGDSLTFTVLTGPEYGSLSGTAPSHQYTPVAGYTGSDSFTYLVNDGELESEIATISITITPPGPVQVFWDDFESDLGWVVDPNNNDTATIGIWERANPESTDSDGSVMQLGETVSGTHDLVTGYLAGSSVGSYDVDSGDTTILSPEISLPAGRELTLSFYYYLAHLNNATADDYLRVSVLGETSQLVFEELGGANTDVATWESFSADISSYSGQTIRLLIEAADAGTASLVEAAIDDVLIQGLMTNNPPSADSQSVVTYEDMAVGVTISGSDPEGAPLTYTVVTQPLHGDLSGTAPELTYMPDANYNGPDSFTFKVNDGTVDSNTATVTITVTPVNDVPVADDQSVSTAEDTAKSITLAGTDVDGNSLTYTIVTQPAHGSLSGDVPNVTYTPTANFNGSDSFAFKVSDGSVDSNVATVSITVTAVNDAPVADSQSVETAEDTATLITLTGSDIESSSLTFTIVNQPVNGTLSGSVPNVTYTPSADYHGSDSFTFMVSDGQTNSATATVNISITPVNDAPVAQDQNIGTTQDTPVDITLSGSDIDGDPLTYAVSTSPTHGTLSGTAPNLTYTPNSGYIGADSFEFTVSDGIATSSAATVSISVSNINDAPVANGQTLSTPEDTSLSITLTGSDPDGDSLTYSIVAQPLHGDVSGTAPELTYTPDANYNGPDSFTFKVNDGTVDSNTATVTITATPVNDAPVAADQSVSTAEDTAKAITLTGTDVDNDTLTYSILSQPTHGSLNGDTPNLIFTPAANFNGSDSFTFKVNDGTVDSNTATVTISVTPVNDAPVAADQSVSTVEDTVKSITLTGSDADGDSLTYSIVAQPLHGNLNGTAAELTYTPAANDHGSDSFAFKVNDGTVDSNTATVTITVTPVNDAPVAEEQSVSTTEDAAKTIVLVGTDADEDVLTYSIVTGPSHGSLSGTGSSQAYTPAANFNGSDSFTFKVNDGTVDSNTATVTITVTPVNDAPVGADESVSTAEDASKAITLSGSDADNDPITYRVITQPAHGSLTGTAPALTYAPEANYNGTDSFTFVTNDGTIDSAPATVTIDITPVNDAPIANGQAVVTSENTAVEITLTGTDVEGSELTFSIQSGPSNGTLTGYGAARTYQPAAGYEGEDSFTFIANDGELNSEPATVSITVTRTNEPPVAEDQTVSTNEDVALGVTLTGSDPDNDPITYVVSANPSHGTLSGTAPNLTYTPDGNYHGPDSFSFVVNDGLVDSAEATIAITVLSVNDAPVADPQSVTVVEDTATDITLSGSDIDGDALTYTIVTGPSHGGLSGTGSIKTYTPAANYNGTDTFTFKVNDGTIDSSIATVTITVTAVNDAPFAINQSVNTAEDTAKPITLSGSDPEGAPLTYTVVTQPLHGDLSDTAPELTYTPDANYYGPDSFTFKVNDGTVDSNTATVTITVTPVNDAPLAEEQSVSTAEDTAKAITLTGTDVDHDTLTYSIVSQPAHGTLNVIGPDVSYTPAANYNGSDSFTFKVNDGTIDSNIATVTITVTAVNDAPVADSQSVNTAEDIALDITLTGSDVELNPLTYSIVTSPTHGTLSGIAPDVTYTPTANYNGPDSFTFRVSDGQTNSATATVSITITPVNDAPIALPQTLSVDEDASLNIVLAGSDVDGGSLTFTVVNGPIHGTLSGTIPNLVYTPVANYNGNDAFTFTVSDGTLVSPAAVIDITIRPVNDLPVAAGQAVTTSENTPVSITLAGSDVDGDALTYIINDGPLHGVLTGTMPNLTYTPFDYYSGTDAFSFYVSDGISNSNSANVTILILDKNYLPIVFNQSVSTSQNSPLAILLTGMDPDGDVLSFFTITPPEHGILSGTAPNLVYTPDPGYTGSDSFTFAASDQQGNSNNGVISIQVNPSGPLTVFFDDFETNLGWVRNAYGTDTATLGWFERANPEGVAYYGDKQLGTTVSGSYDLVTGPLAGYSAGSYDLDGGKTSMLSPVIELPVGRDLELSFSYYVAHYTNSSTADYLRVYIIGESTVRIFEELGANNDDDAVWEVFNGNISSFAGQNVQILIEAADASTASYFEAAVDDILIEATTPNNPPFAESQSYEMAEDTNLELTLAGSDPNGDVITFLIETPPSHGSLSGTLPNLVYTPDSNYNGIDSFTYVVNDGKLDSEPATISLTITPVNDAPQAIAQTVSTSMDTRLDITLAGTDVDGDGLQFNITSFPTVGILGGYVPNMVYIPLEGYIGEDSFTFVVFDGVEESLPATVNISVNPAGPMTVFWDDFETDQGWVVNPNGIDTATSGAWLRANPDSVYYYGYKQLGTTVSGSYDLVTGPLAGSSSGSYDLDGGLTSIRSPQITLPTGRDITLSFSYYLAHYTNSSTADYLRIKIVGSTTATLFQELGANNDDDAIWSSYTASLNNYAGQTVYLLIEAADASTASLVEAAIDDVLIIAE